MLVFLCPTCGVLLGVDFREPLQLFNSALDFVISLREILQSQVVIQIADIEFGNDLSDSSTQEGVGRHEAGALRWVAFLKVLGNVIRLKDTTPIVIEARDCCVRIHDLQKSRAKGKGLDLI